MRGSLRKTVPLELTMNEHANRLINMRQPNTLNSQFGNIGHILGLELGSTVWLLASKVLPGRPCTAKLRTTLAPKIVCREPS